MKLNENLLSISNIFNNEKLLRLATEASHVGVWEIDFESKQVNRNIFHDLAFGYNELQECWSVDKYFEHIHPDDISFVLDTSKKLQVDKTIQNFEFRVIWPDKSIHWVKVSASIEGLQKVGTIIDITEKKLGEIALNEALFYRDEFLSIASHELKTPLTTLKLQSQLFKRLIARKDPAAYMPDKVERLIDQTDRQVSRLSRLIDNMLDISRIRTGRLSFNFEKINISELVSSVAKRTNTHVDHLDEVFFVCDKHRVEQVLMNLINNAHSYGLGRPVRVTLYKTESYFSISVIDQGIGICPQNINKIFNRFKRAVPASEVSGIGLGLYISREIINAHDGKIEVESEVGKGSTFTICLPLGVK
jgi:signal transduction histidine kinase